MIKKFLLTLLIVGLSVFGYYYQDISKTLNTATGYAAKNLCSGHFNSGYPLEQLMAEALVPVNPALGYVSYEKDAAEQAIHTHIFGLKSRTAKYRPGMGCTLLGVGQESLSGSIVRLQQSAPDPSIAWPEGNALAATKPDIDYQILAKAIDDAFIEPTTGHRNTKAVVVIHKGELIAEQYAAPISANTPSLSWSMAKSVTNLLIGTLVHKDKLDIMTPAPVAAWQADERAQITTDQLLRMSSGLAFNEDYGINTDVTTMLSNATSASDYAINMPLAHPVDSHWAYSSGTTNILTRIIFDTIGGSLQDKYDYADEALFTPIGLQSATMETDGSNVFIGSSYFYATPHDWARLGQLMLQDGVWNGVRLLPEGWVDYSTQPTHTAANREYGAQFWLNSEPTNDYWTPPWPSVSNDAYFMNGYQGQVMIVIPAKELVVVRLGYTAPGTDTGVNNLLEGIIKAIY